MNAPSTWKAARFGDFAHVQHGWPFRSQNYAGSGSGLPIVVSIGNFEYTGGFRFDRSNIKGYEGEYPPEYELNPGDLLLVMTCQTAGGEILGVPARVPDDGRVYLHNQRIGKVVFDLPGELDADFAYHLARTPEFNRQLYATASGSKILHTAPKRIEAVTFGRPPFAEQRAIAEVLGALDDKIAANASLVSAAESLMLALAGSAPKRARLEEIAVQRTTQLKPHEFSDGVAHFSLPAFDESVSPDIAAGSSIKSNKFHLVAPSVLVSKLNPRIPRAWNVPVLPVEMALASTEFVVLEPNGVDASELWAAVSQPEVWTTLQGKVAGTSGSHQRVRPLEVVSLPVRDVRALPNVARLGLQTLGLRVFGARQESAALARTRDALLPLLMSGKVRVKDVERAVEEAT